MCDCLGVTQESAVCLTPVVINVSRRIEKYFIVWKYCIKSHVMLSRHPFVFWLDQGRPGTFWHSGQAINLGVQGKLNIWRPFVSIFLSFFFRPRTDPSNILRACVQIADNLRRNSFSRGNKSFPAPYSRKF